MSVGASDVPRRRAGRSARIDDVLAGFSIARLRFAAILTGGAVGALARGGLGEALPHGVGAWPWSTFIANLLGAFFLGWLLTRLVERIAPTTNWRPLLGTGLAGALTTFSTFEIETFDLAHSGHVGLAVAYALTSVAAGLALAIAGVILARCGRHW